MGPEDIAAAAAALQQVQQDGRRESNKNLLKAISTDTELLYSHFGPKSRQKEYKTRQDKWLSERRSRLWWLALLRRGNHHRTNRWMWPTSIATLRPLFVVLRRRRRLLGCFITGRCSRLPFFEIRAKVEVLIACAERKIGKERSHSPIPFQTFEKEQKEQQNVRWFSSDRSNILDH